MIIEHGPKNHLAPNSVTCGKYLTQIRTPSGKSLTARTVNAPEVPVHVQRIVGSSDILSYTVSQPSVLQTPTLVLFCSISVRSARFDCVTRLPCQLSPFVYCHCRASIAKREDMEKIDCR